MTTLTFRNIEVHPDDPVSEWGLEGIQTALERGNIAHWRRLAHAVRENPWGPVSRDLETVLTYSHPYGVADLMDRVIVTARSAREVQERAEVAAQVRELIAASGLSKKEFAASIGTSRSRLSTYANGSVIPSAALMVRMHRVSH